MDGGLCMLRFWLMKRGSAWTRLKDEHAGLVEFIPPWHGQRVAVEAQKGYTCDTAGSGLESGFVSGPAKQTAGCIGWRQPG
jgi:hypothetical protein